MTARYGYAAHRSKRGKNLSQRIHRLGFQIGLIALLIVILLVVVGMGWRLEQVR